MCRHIKTLAFQVGNYNRNDTIQCEGLHPHHSTQRDTSDSSKTVYLQTDRTRYITLLALLWDDGVVFMDIYRLERVNGDVECTVIPLHLWPVLHIHVCGISLSALNAADLYDGKDDDGDEEADTDNDDGSDGSSACKHQPHLLWKNLQ